MSSRSNIRTLVGLTLADQMGARRISRLIRQTGDPEAIFDLSKQELMSVDGIGPNIADSILQFDDWEAVDRILEQSDADGSQLLTLDHEAYPDRLKQIYDPPILLWVKGDPAVLDLPAIAIVGTRNAGKYGRGVARDFARELSANGLVITSGLAYGIDTEAHRETVNCGGKTVAVLGSGIDTIYPRSNAKLAQDIVESGGAVISEFPLGTNPDAGNFPVRNRVVSGMTLGTLVVESGLKGGSMITANSALNQNREVFVIPHLLTSPNGAGCNSLIRDGVGKLVLSVEDILTEIGHLLDGESASATPPKPNWESAELSDKERIICKQLTEGPLHIDKLAEQLDTQPFSLMADLLQLEMKECVRQSAGKVFELR